MAILAIFVFWVLVITALIQAVFGLQFAWVLRRRVPETPADVRWPKVAILMSLRGADSQLADGLRRLMDQDYPDYELHIVVDSVVDPAWEVVESVGREFTGRRFSLSPLIERRATCGLKCSALVQAAAELGSDVEIVVTADDDLMPHRQWLRELVQPFFDQRVGVTFGNRWFMPDPPVWGALIRSIWNVAGVVPMYLFGIPWGGCCAIRRSAFDQSQIVEYWKKSIVDDAPIKSRIDALGLQARFVPSLMMPLRESCSLAFTRDFLKRQLTWTRLYHPNWSPIVVHAVATSVIWLLAGGLAIYGASTGESAVWVYSLGGIVAYLSIMLLLIAVLELSVRKGLRRRGHPTAWMRWYTPLMMIPGIPLTQLVYLDVVLQACFCRRVVWRGVTYELRGPWDIRLVADTAGNSPAQAIVAAETPEGAPARR